MFLFYEGEEVSSGSVYFLEHVHQALVFTSLFCGNVSQTKSMFYGNRQINYSSRGKFSIMTALLLLLLDNNNNNEGNDDNLSYSECT